MESDPPTGDPDQLARAAGEIGAMGLDGRAAIAEGALQQMAAGMAAIGFDHVSIARAALAVAISTALTRADHNVVAAWLEATAHDLRQRRDAAGTRGNA